MPSQKLRPVQKSAPGLKDIIVIYRKKEIILTLISLKRYFSHPEKSILNLSLP